MKIIGLTGGFGTGKTFVSSILRSLGAKVIDADKIAHDCLKKNGPVRRKVLKAFGRGVLSSGGSIDRSKLAEKVFGSRKKLAKLERIIHPEVIRSIMAGIARARFGQTVVIDAPLLIEAGLDRIADTIIVVKTSRSRQIARCMKKFGMDRRDVERRIAGQIPLNKKVRMADFVIDNNGTMSETRKKTENVWREIVWK